MCRHEYELEPVGNLIDAVFDSDTCHAITFAAGTYAATPRGSRALPRYPEIVLGMLIAIFHLNDVT